MTGTFALKRLMSRSGESVAPAFYHLQIARFCSHIQPFRGKKAVPAVKPRISLQHATH